jgi:hypothetical protein
LSLDRRRRRFGRFDEIRDTRHPVARTTTSVLSRSPNQAMQIDSVDVRHGKVLDGPLVAGGKDRHNVRLVQPGEHALFTQEPFARLRQRTTVSNDLHDHAAVKRLLDRFTHDPHATMIDLADDAEIAEPNGERNIDIGCRLVQDITKFHRCAQLTSPVGVPIAERLDHLLRLGRVFQGRQ